jgi:hypothetical protein
MMHAAPFPLDPPPASVCVVAARGGAVASVAAVGEAGAAGAAGGARPASDNNGEEKTRQRH